MDLGHHRRGLRPCEKGGSLTGPNPVDRGKKGSKLHVLSDAQSIPLAFAVSGANLHDSHAFKPLIRAIPAVRPRRRPRRRRPVKIRADKAHFSAVHLAWLRGRDLVPRIARPGVESGERLGRHRWKIERSISRLFGYRRPTVRYERKGSHFLAFLGPAAALTCYKKLAKLTT
ncbi:Transposase DDE domain protein [Streptomyces malaysiensis subsp. malaysiensis]|nr:Transposase DDE domain protein [Streptomyces sp. M56]